MQAFTTVEGIAAPLPGANIDTDVIMPKQFLKGLDRAGLGIGAFHNLRFDAEGRPRSDFILNQPPWREAKFLIVGPNFGCGSSREHAVWGLLQIGVRALIGTSFAGIFFDNCANNGLLAITLPRADVESLLTLAADPERNEIKVDVGKATIESLAGAMRFDIDALRRERFLLGLDPIEATLRGAPAIRDFESRHFASSPWLKTQA